MRPNDWRKKNRIQQIEYKKNNLTKDDIELLEEIVKRAKRGEFVDFMFAASLNTPDDMVFVGYTDYMSIRNMSKLTTESLLCVYDAVKEDKEDKQNG